MRNRLLMIVAVGMLVGCGATADSEWGVFGSYWSPKDGDDSFGGGLKLGFDLVESVQFELRAGIFGDLLDGLDGVPADLEAIPLEGGLALTFPTESGLEAYVGGGLGYYYLDGSGAAADVDNELGFYAVGGVEWTVHRSGASDGETSAKLFAELLYRFVSADSNGASPVPLDISLDGPGVQVGLLIGW